jgi:pimeloyl-ACP methyl ester carboxylesterase
MTNVFRESMPRPIIGIGHSMGGAHLTQLALIHPRLFETLILIDPVTQSFINPKGFGLPAQSSAVRRDRWPSREAALEGFKRSKFYQPWDPRVLDLWVKFGLRDLPTKLHGIKASAHPYEQQEVEVTLTTTKLQEVFTFLRPVMPSEPQHGFTKSEWDQLRASLHPDLDGRVWEHGMEFYRPEPIIIFGGLVNLRPSVLYIFGEHSPLSNERSMTEKLKVTGTGSGGSGGVPAGRVKGFIIAGTGHLIAMEKVKETAKQSADWIKAQLATWQQNEKLLKRMWDLIPDIERYSLRSDLVVSGGKRSKDAKI